VDSAGLVPAMSWRIGAVLIVLLAGGLVLRCGCRLDRAEEELVQTWLRCDDCADPIRAQVAALGDCAVPALQGALTSGPPSPGRAYVEAQFRALYAQLAPLPASEADFVATYLAHYVTTWQLRAALSLDDIGSPRALAALRAALAADSAGTAPLPAEARRAALLAVGRGGPAYTGSLRDTVVAALDTVTVHRGTETWDGDESVVLPGGPLPTGLVVGRWPDSLRFVAAAPPGRYPVVVTGEPRGDAVAPLRVTRFSAPSVPEPLAPLVESSDPLPRVHLLALGRPPMADTVAWIRVDAGAADRPVTAVADWSGPGDVDLLWYACGTLDPRGSAAGATAGRPERSGAAVPAGTCWSLAVILRAPVGPPVFVRLELLPP